MRGLLLRLANLDSDAGAALRVIEYFDRLIEHSANLEAITRAAAALACCTAGLRDDNSGLVLRFGPNGQPGPPQLDMIPVEVPIVIDEIAVGHVWLERQDPHALDQILIERMAVTATARWRVQSADDRLDPALVETIIGEAASEDERIRCLRLVGLSPAANLQAIFIADASTGPEQVARIVAALRIIVGKANGTMRASGSLGMSIAVLVQGVDIVDTKIIETCPRLSREARIGIGHPVPATDAARSWASARTAARFAPARRLAVPVIDFRQLGALSTLTTVPREVALSNPDVQTLLRFATAPSGHRDLDTYLEVMWSGSARRAAEALHMHHSSITNRIRHVEQALDLRLDQPTERVRIQVAVLLWSLFESSNAP